MAVSLLLADDSPTIAKILSLALSKDDYAVRSVTTADQALEEIHKNPPQLFLVDIALPMKNGKEFIKYIRNAPKLSHIKVVLVTNAFEPVNEAELLNDGANGVLTKPFDPATLRQKLAEVMGTTSSLPPPPPPSFDSLEISMDSKDAALPIQKVTNPLEPNPTDEEYGIHEIGSKTFITGIPRQRDTVLPPPENEPTVALDLLSMGGQEALKMPQEPPPPSTPAAAPSAPPPLPVHQTVSETFKPTEIPDTAEANQAALNEFFNAQIDAPIVPGETPSGVFEMPDIGMNTRANIQASIANIAGNQHAAGASVRENPGLFDVGGSNFAFSADYVNRLTKAFEGTGDEPVPKDFKQQPKLEEPVFPTASTDAGRKETSSWTSMDLDKMETMIRAEVRTAIQEIVPKLAEKLIREELARVMQEAEN